MSWRWETGLGNVIGIALRCFHHALVSLQEVRKISESIKYNHPLRKYVDTILRKVSGIQFNH